MVREYRDLRSLETLIVFSSLYVCTILDTTVSGYTAQIYTLSHLSQGVSANRGRSCGHSLFLCSSAISLSFSITTNSSCTVIAGTPLRLSSCATWKTRLASNHWSCCPIAGPSNRQGLIGSFLATTNSNKFLFDPSFFMASQTIVVSFGQLPASLMPIL